MRDNVLIAAATIALLIVGVGLTRYASTPSESGEVVFETGRYRVVLEEDGGAAITSPDGDPLLRTLRVEVETGRTWTVQGIVLRGAERFEVDSTEGLEAGMEILLRNERRFGRLNFPETDRLRIAAIEGSEVVLEAPITTKFSKKQQLIFTQTETAAGALETSEITTGEKGAELTQRWRLPYGELRLRWTFQQGSGVVGLDAELTYDREVTVYSERLILDFGPSATEVFRKNRQLDLAVDQDDYWLDRQGARFGEGERSVLIYHTPGVSSLRLVPDDSGEMRRLIVYLDDQRDHPFRRLFDTRRSRHLNAARRDPGDRRANHLDLHIGFAGPVPRLMTSPGGHLATFVWTEHADFATLESNRATYFGCQDILRAEDAQGGFVGHAIPVTKSVFYANPDAEVSRYHPEYGPQASIRDTPGFLEFLRQLERRGYEVVMHTTAPDFFGMELSREAISFFAREFASRAWIDHRMTSVLDSLSSRGLVRASPYYHGDDWREAGVRYFWHAGSEDHARQRFDDGYNLDMLMSRRGDRYVTPLYWRHPTVLEDVISWPAMTVGRLDRYYTDELLSELVRNWGVHINHVYASALNKGLATANYLEAGEDGLCASEKFETTLKRLAALRDGGDLNITTIEAILDYWLALEQVRFAYRGDGTVEVINAGDRAIEDLALAIRAGSVAVDGAPPEGQRQIGDDLIVWFDLVAGARRRLTFD